MLFATNENQEEQVLVLHLYIPFLIESIEITNKLYKGVQRGRVGSRPQDPIELYLSLYFLNI